MPALGIALLALVLPQAAGVAYFPPSLPTTKVLCSSAGPPGEQAVLDPFENRWYSSHLKAAGEPSLYLEPRKAGASRLRFTWLRSFHPPVVVRVEWNGSGSGRLVAKQLSGAGGYDPGTVARTLDRPLSAQESAALKAMLETTHLFQQSPRGCDMGLDGAQWIIEGADDHGYHFLDRWSPRKGDVRAVGLAMLRLTGWKFGEIY